MPSKKAGITSTFDRSGQEVRSQNEIADVSATFDEELYTSSRACANSDDVSTCLAVPLFTMDELGTALKKM